MLPIELVYFISMRRTVALISILACCIALVYYFKLSPSTTSSRNTFQTVPDSVLFTSAPVLSPEEALATFQLADGFQIELVASEPLIKSPIAMTFDNQGRIWVVEMQSYMTDADGSEEDGKESRIVILEDKDGDGVMDEAKVFLDNLGMPRAITMVEGGILYADPPNLWFVENLNDKPGSKIVIDSTYAVGGNPEHQPNGLMRGIDNWYYNAKSGTRYRYINKKWVKEKTEFRGQWGITKDDYGRLFYNTNSNQLRGDLVPPNKLMKNPDFKEGSGINVEFSSDQRVYPIRPTPGVNRGYQDWVLDQSGRLKYFTAACGPLIYRGDNYPDEFQGNAFVCEPAGNLIKRNIIQENGLYVEAAHAYEDKEFLASKDERFRPVSLYNGPDGSMYVVDMYKGIIQHEVYLTDYLRDQIQSRGLEKPLGLGRIYKVTYKGDWKNRVRSKLLKQPNQPNLLQASDKDLVQYLSHPNGWWRDNAQRVLIERNNRATIPALIDILKSQNNSITKLHALWTLEGMDVFTPEVIKLGISAEDHKVVAAALRIGERNSINMDAEVTLAIYEEVLKIDSEILQLQLALSLGEFMESNPTTVMDMLAVIAKAHENEPLIREAIKSSIVGSEQIFLDLLKTKSPESLTMISSLSESIDIISLRNSLSSKALSPTAKQQYIVGKPLYETACASCHGSDGQGLVPIAPPLVESEWVEGSEERLILVVLHGLEGPITVRGKVYAAPEVQPVMPGIKYSQEFTDEKIAALLTYIRNAWTNEASAIHPETVSTIRKATMDRKMPYTEEELRKHFKEWE